MAGSVDVAVDSVVVLLLDDFWSWNNICRSVGQRATPPNAKPRLLTAVTQRTELSTWNVRYLITD